MATAKTITVDGETYEVEGVSRGWVKFIDKKGNVRSVRAAKAAKQARVSKKEAAKAAKPVKAAATERMIGDTAVDLTKYVKVVTKAGNNSLDNGDKAAKALRDLTLDQIYKEVARNVKEDLEAANIEEAEKILRKKYGHLNPGMQRMNLGNRFRAALRAA